MNIDGMLHFRSLPLGWKYPINIFYWRRPATLFHADMLTCWHADMMTSSAWLVNVGATGWGRRSEYLGFEVHDFQNRGIFVLFDVWLDNLVLNCRSSNARRVPDAGTKGYEKLLNDGRKWSGFQTYDHLMRHILTNWKISNCGGVARGFAPWVEGGQVDDSNLALFTIPANGFGPEVQLVSSGAYNYYGVH